MHKISSDFVHAENLIPMVNKCVRQTGTQAANADRQKRIQHVGDFLMKQSGKVKDYIQPNVLL